MHLLAFCYLFYISHFLNLFIQDFDLFNFVFASTAEIVELDWLPLYLDFADLDPWIWVRLTLFLFLLVRGLFNEQDGFISLNFRLRSSRLLDSNIVAHELWQFTDFLFIDLIRHRCWSPNTYTLVLPTLCLPQVDCRLTCGRSPLYHLTFFLFDGSCKLDGSVVVWVEWNRISLLS